MTKFFREVSTPAPKVEYGNVRLRAEEIAFLDQEQMTFSEFTHRNFIQAMNKTKEKKLLRFSNYAVWIIIGLGLLSAGSVPAIPYNVRITIGTIGVFLVFIGCIQAWQSLKAG